VEGGRREEEGGAHQRRCIHGPSFYRAAGGVRRREEGGREGGVLRHGSVDRIKRFVARRVVENWLTRGADVCRKVVSFLGRLIAISKLWNPAGQAAGRCLLWMGACV
jgi:hypothetical protein